MATQLKQRELKKQAAKQEIQLQQEKRRQDDEDKMRMLQVELELQEKRQQERLVALREEAVARKLQVQTALENMAATTLQSSVRKLNQRKTFMAVLRYDPVGDATAETLLMLCIGCKLAMLRSWWREAPLLLQAMRKTELLKR